MTTQYNDLETDEINILTGALRLKQKCVKVRVKRISVIIKATLCPSVLPTVCHELMTMQCEVYS